MTLPIITTKATNVELTDERKSLIRQKLAPLSRLLVHERNVTLDVNIRCIKAGFGSEVFYVAVKLSTDKGSFIAASTGHYLTRTLIDVRESLRRSISRGRSVSTFGVYATAEQLKEAYTLTL